MTEPSKKELAQSGVVCRYLCQAEPQCRHWTFVIPGSHDPDSGGPCLMYNSSHASSPWKQEPEQESKVVSGLRFCKPEEHHDLLVSRKTLTDESELPIFSSAENAAGAAQAILSEGWAVLRGALSDPLLTALREACSRAALDLLARDPQRVGNRGPRRYSWGGASTSHHMVHLTPWAQLLDVDSVVKVLEALFGEYVAIGGGGDFVLGETDTHQRLHVDLQLEAMYASPAPAALVANFVVSDISCQDGPVRLVPKTQQMPLASQLSKDWGYATHLQKESYILSHANLSYVFACPLKPGDVLLRDMRLWHGGSPNLGADPRYLPSAEFLSRHYAEALIISTGEAITNHTCYI